MDVFLANSPSITRPKSSVHAADGGVVRHPALEVRVNHWMHAGRAFILVDGEMTGCRRLTVVGCDPASVLYDVESGRQECFGR